MNLRRYNILQRVLSWKNSISNAVASLQAENDLRSSMAASAQNETAQLRSQLDAARARLAELEDRIGPIHASSSTLLGLIAQAVESSAEQTERQDAIEGQVVQAAAQQAERQGALEARMAQVAIAQESLAAQQAQLDSRQQTLTENEHKLEVRFQELESSRKELLVEQASLFRTAAQSEGGVGRLIARADGLYLVERGESAVIIAALVEGAGYRSGDVSAIVSKLADGSLSKLFVVADPPVSGEPVLESADELIPLFRQMPRLAAALFLQFDIEDGAESLQPAEFYAYGLNRLRVNPYTIDSLAELHKLAFGEKPTPFDKPEEMPGVSLAQPKRRSALFLHNNYYHFNMMSDGLRKRGWDALTVSLEAADSPQRQFYHGEDVNLHDPDPALMREKVRAFFRTEPARFESLHFYGQGYASFFPDHLESPSRPPQVPWDFFELRRHRMTIGYMPSGCLDGARQSDIRRVTGGLCSKCIWEREPSVCNDARSAAWAERLEAVCDWIGLEGDWVAGSRTGPKYVRGPVITALDPLQWRPDIEPPQDLRIARASEEVLVYHAVGNYEARRRAGRDIKGTGAVIKAVEKLREAGLPVRLIFFSDILSTQIKYLQVQADIVVDQLHYGRYGATARECMMLGLPVVGALDARQEGTEKPLRLIEECPIVHATPETIADTLRALVNDPAARARIGRASRDFAINWHGIDACAERYERVIDRIRNGLAPDSPDLYPGLRSVDAANIDQFTADSAPARSHRAPAA